MKVTANVKSLVEGSIATCNSPAEASSHLPITLPLLLSACFFLSCSWLPVG